MTDVDGYQMWVEMWMDIRCGWRCGWISDGGGASSPFDPSYNRTELFSGLGQLESSGDAPTSVLRTGPSAVSDRPCCCLVIGGSWLSPPGAGLAVSEV